LSIGVDREISGLAIVVVLLLLAAAGASVAPALAAAFIDPIRVLRAE